MSTVEASNTSGMDSGFLGNKRTIDSESGSANSTPRRKKRAFNPLTPTTQLVFRVVDVVANFLMAIDIMRMKDSDSRDVHQLMKLPFAAKLEIDHLEILCSRLEKKIKEIEKANPNTSQSSTLGGAISTITKKDSPSKRPNTKICSHEQLFGKMNEVFKDFHVSVSILCTKIPDVGDLPKLKRLLNTAKISIEDLNIASDNVNKLIATDTASAHANQNAESPNETSSTGESESNSSNQDVQLFLDSLGGKYGSQLMSNFKQYMERRND